MRLRGCSDPARKKILSFWRRQGWGLATRAVRGAELQCSKKGRV